jgi:hypothetical protein
MAHPNSTCQEYAKTLKGKAKEVKQSEALIRNQCRKCPHCNADTFKNGGCNHMVSVVDVCVCVCILSRLDSCVTIETNCIVLFFYMK